MQFLRKIRISIKATIMMVVLMGAAISLGAFALFEVSGLAEDAGTLQSDVDGIRQIASAMDDASQVRALVNMLPYAKDTTNQQEYLRQANELRLDLQKNWGAYRVNTLPGEERDLAQVVGQRLEAFERWPPQAYRLAAGRQANRTDLGTRRRIRSGREEASGGIGRQHALSE